MDDMVRAGDLSFGEYIRDPKKRSRILVVTCLGPQVYVRGLDESDIKQHRYFNVDEVVERVTNVVTPTSVVPTQEEGG